VFTNSGGNWSQQAELSASDGAAGDWFGDSVALSGEMALRLCWGRLDTLSMGTRFKGRRMCSRLRWKAEPTGGTYGSGWGI